MTMTTGFTNAENWLIFVLKQFKEIAPSIHELEDFFTDCNNFQDVYKDAHSAVIDLGLNDYDRLGLYIFTVICLLLSEQGIIDCGMCTVLRSRCFLRCLRCFTLCAIHNYFL